MTTIHFVRHGETVWHHENRYAGISDIALTDLGHRQAVTLAAWAATAGVDRVLCSDLSRAVQTAERSAEAVGVPLAVDARLREVDFGRAEGMTGSEMVTAFPSERQRFLLAPASSPLPGGESGAAAVERAGTVLVELAASGDVVLIVAHTTLGRLLLCHLLGLPLNEYRRVFPSVGNGTVTTFEVPSDVTDVAGLRGRAALLRFNAPV